MPPTGCPRCHKKSDNHKFCSENCKERYEAQKVWEKHLEEKALREELIQKYGVTIL